MRNKTSDESIYSKSRFVFEVHEQERDGRVTNRLAGGSKGRRVKSGTNGNKMRSGRMNGRGK